MLLLVTDRGDLPTGTVTFLFSDIEGSTPLAERHPDVFPDLLLEHRSLLRDAVMAHAGAVVSLDGDEMFAVFASALPAVSAAIDGQRSLETHDWPSEARIRVRMGAHTGQGVLADGGYVGLDVHRAARVAAAAHGGQVLVSGATARLVDAELPEGCSLRDLGEHRLRGIGGAVRLCQVVAPGLPSLFPSPRAPGVTPHNLPAQLTTYVGRGRETQEVAALVRTQRLVTLTGPGGIGKTRLATEAASGLLDDFSDGVVFVSLAAVTDPSLLLPAVVAALEIGQGAGPPLERIGAHLADRSVLLVLDNMEQIVTGAAQLTDLLVAAPGLAILATSRSPLRLAGEHEYPVGPLDLPEPGDVTAERVAEASSVRLLAERIGSIRPGFTVDTGNADVLAAIAARLEGLPLAIELAAARTRLLTPAELLARLDDRLGVLSAGSRDLPGRQQTLRDTIAWSYDLLGAPSRLLFRRMAVFSGAGLDEIESVVGSADELDGDLLDALGLLVDQSLVQRAETAGRSRYHMLAVIRDFAAAELDADADAEEVRRRHAEVCLRMAEEAAPHLVTRDQTRWLDRLEAEHDNLRSALSWLLVHDADAAARLAAAVWRFWQMRGHLVEARERLSTVLAASITSPMVWAAALEAAGGVAYWQGDKVSAQRCYRERLELHRELADPVQVAEALYDLAFAGDPDEAEALLTESLHIFEESGNRRGVARALFGLADVVGVTAGNWAAAERYGEESLRMFREIDDPFGLGWMLFDLASVALVRQPPDPVKGGEYLEESMRIFTEIRDLSALTFHLWALARLASLEGNHVRAARLAGASARLQRVSGTDLIGVAPSLGTLDLSVAELGEEAFSAAFAEGELMTFDEAIEYARRRTESAGRVAVGYATPASHRRD